MADDQRTDETVEERRKRRIEEARAKLRAKQSEAGSDAAIAAGEAERPTPEESEKMRGPGTVSANAEGLIPPGARPADETAEDVKAMVEGPGGAVESTTELAPSPAKPPADETVEERRKRRIEEARAKLKAQQAAAPPVEAPPPVEVPPPPPVEAKPPAEETVEERRKRRIEEARAKLKGQQAEAAPPPPAAPPAEETVEERRKRRIEEARAKMKAQVEGAPAAPAAAPPADETPEERRKRKIEEARAKLKGGAAAAPAAPPPAAAPAAPVGKKAKAGAETKDVSDDPLVVKLREMFGDAIVSAVAMVGQRIVVVKRGAQPDVVQFLVDDDLAKFDLLVDLTAVHRPEEEPPFEVVYQLCSTSSLGRLRVKVPLADGESVPTVSHVWSTANWLEREAYDMFGIRFDGHPDLRRILMPEGWEGHPLRKEYPVEFRENQWIRDNLNIVELPADADFTGKFEA